MNSNSFSRNAFLFLTAAIVLLYGVKAEALTLSPVRFELTADPGATVSGEMVLTNERETTETYYSSFSNFEAQGESGSPNFITPTEGLGTWMSTQASLTLQSGESQIVPFQIKVPSDAEPGGNFAAIFWSTSPSDIGEGGAVVIGARTGILVLLSVNGEVEVSGGVTGYTTKDEKSYYESLPIEFVYRFRNDGGDRIKPEGDITIKNLFGFTKAVIPANTVEGNVLPTQIRRFETAWVGNGKNASTEPELIDGFFNKAKNEWRNFALGRFTATLDLTYGETEQKTQSKIAFWVFPWHFLIVFLVLLILALYTISKLMRAYNRWIIARVEERMIAEGKISSSRKTN